MTTWYLCAENDHPPTSGYLMKVIGKQNSEYLHKDKKCADGKRRNLYECPQGYFDVRRAIVAVQEYALKIQVFKEESFGEPEQFVLWKPLVRKRKMHATLKRGIRHGSSVQK